MYLNNKDLFDLELLCITLENHLDINEDDVDMLKNLVNKLKKQKEKKDKFNSEYIKEKRKNDKTYGRSFKEKQRMLGI